MHDCKHLLALRPSDAAHCDARVYERGLKFVRRSGSAGYAPRFYICAPILHRFRVAHHSFRPVLCPDFHTMGKNFDK